MSEKLTTTYDEESKGTIVPTEVSASQENSYESTESPSFSIQFSRQEEAQVIRILDTRLFPWILLTT